MHSFSKILILVLVAFSAAQKPVPWDTVDSDLKVANDITSQILKDCKAYLGTAAQFQTLAGSINKHQTQIIIATNDTKAAVVPTQAQAQSTLDFLNNTTFPNVQAVLDCLVSKRDLFIRGGVLSTVCQVLKNLKAYFDALFDALIAKVPPPLKPAFQALKAKFDQAFDKALKALGCT